MRPIGGSEVDDDSVIVWNDVSSLCLFWAVLEEGQCRQCDCSCPRPYRSLSGITGKLLSDFDKILCFEEERRKKVINLWWLMWNLFWMLVLPNRVFSTDLRLAGHFDSLLTICVMPCERRYRDVVWVDIPTYNGAESTHRCQPASTSPQTTDFWCCCNRGEFCVFEWLSIRKITGVLNSIC